MNAMRIHQPDRSTSWRRLTPTAMPGINRAKEIMALRAVIPNTASSTVATTVTSMPNKYHHQYYDLLDRVRKSKYLRNPETTASLCVI